VNSSDSPQLLPETWDTYVARHLQGSILQTASWGALKQEFGWDWEIVTTGDPQAPAAGALVLYRPLPLHLGTLAYVPRGPLVDWGDAAQTQSILQALENAARRHHAWALWLEPALLDDEETRRCLRSCGLRPTVRTVQPPRTILVDIAPDEEAILAQMKQKTRYNIRLAERKGVTVRTGTPADAETFYALMTETGGRDAFGIHSAAYYRRVLELFLPRDQGVLLFADVEGEAVAAIVVLALGTQAWYFYGASSNRHREKMPTYALQWEAIRWAKQRGCTTYDLWGIPDADEAALEAEFEGRDDGLWGVYRFKRGFGGQIVRFAGLWEKPLHPLYPLAARFRKLT
jgi:lipid II:glycine glycyltransferase (peptidoglycan interpeptide bridge formation enzyme)